MELTWYRTLVIAVALAVTTAGLWSRWRSGDLVDTHRTRVLQVCATRMLAAGYDGGVEAMRADMDDRWKWGRFEFDSKLFADRLAHRDAEFEAVRVSLYSPLADANDGRSQCRMAVCIYSVPLDDAVASIRDGQCGGSGGHRLVTPALKPDILNQK